MPSFLKRYHGGECEQVWSDLIALGAAVREEPVYSDAVAVARETMRRARANIETLIGRLHAAGYEFETQKRFAQERLDKMDRHQTSMTRTLERLRSAGTETPALMGSAGTDFMEKLRALNLASLEHMAKPHPWREQARESYRAAAAEPEKENPLDDKRVFSEPEGGQEQFEEAEEAIGGPLPISLRAWFENIGHVSFLGWHSVLNPNVSAGRPKVWVNPAMFAALGGKAPHFMDGFDIVTGTPHPTEEQTALPDPLMILPLKTIVEMAEEGEGGPYELSPDDLHKGDISGDAYYVDLPEPGMDVVFEDWRGDRFVAYLRRVFRWAGFPGLERRKNPPLDLIHDLTRDLLPL